MTCCLKYPPKLLQYTDYISLYLSHRGLKQPDDCVETAHNSALNWFSSNKLLCNRAKTQQIQLSLLDNSEYQSVKLLVLNIENRLDWRVHMDIVCKRIPRVSYLMWKLRELVGNEYLRVAYCILSITYFLKVTLVKAICCSQRHYFDSKDSPENYL